MATDLEKKAKEAFIHDHFESKDGGSELPCMEKVVFYALPALGHLMSMVELGKLLLTQNPSTKITILAPTRPLQHTLISSYISYVSSILPCITFHIFPPIPLINGDPSNYNNSEEIIFEMFHNNNKNVEDFLKKTHSLSSPVSAVVLDYFCYHALEISKSLNIPTYFYFSTNASALALYLNFPEFDKKLGDQSFRSLGATPFEIPGLFSVPASSMLEPMLDRGMSYDGFVNIGTHLGKSDGVIINTFELLEKRAVECLKDGTCLVGSPVFPIYCIGPLIADRVEGDNNGGGEKDECLKWLDSQLSQSVVYLCFGSGGMFCREQIREIAIGLERSGVRFLWVVRAPHKGKRLKQPSEPDLDSVLPSGFLERTKDRGLVVKTWAPQVKVLGHQAVGGFVTHCGWNSTLEAVCAGVPMVAWPVYAEQRFNKVLLVEEIGIALPMNESEDRFVNSNEIERRVKQIVDSQEGELIRRRVVELSHEAKLAVGEGGSSKVALAKLVELWKC